jgi:uncharacterized protein (TIGR03000 family)
MSEVSRRLLSALLVAGLAGSLAPALADGPLPPRSRATVTVLLPGGYEYQPTEVRVDGVLVAGKGAKRTFSTKPIEKDKEQTYKFEALIQPNNYTKITRTRSVTVKAGDKRTVDMTKLDLKQPDKVVIRWVPTPRDVARKMCEMAKIGKDDIVYDLGCGDGIMIITAVKDAKAKKGIGIDIDPDRVKEAKEAAKEAGIADRIEIRKGDVLDVPSITEASVVMLYMGDEMNMRLRPMLWKSLKPGSRIVSHRFTMGDWKPDRSITMTGEDGDEYDLHVWTITGKEGKKKDRKK